MSWCSLSPLRYRLSSSTRCLCVLTPSLFKRSSSCNPSLLVSTNSSLRGGGTHPFASLLIVPLLSLGLDPLSKLFILDASSGLNLLSVNNPHISMLFLFHCIVFIF